MDLEADATGSEFALSTERSRIVLLLPKLGLCPLVPNRNTETEFEVKEKRIALLLCQTKEATAG